MWPAAFVALLVGGPLGACLFIAAGITHFVKVAKVDAQYAKQGKTPPSHALIEKWLDGRKAAGKAPKSAKVAKPGLWRYAWQRWQAMWEDLSDKHKEVRSQYKTAVAHAKAKGQQPPPKPTMKETLTGWKWHLDQLAPPAPPATANPNGQATPAATAGSDTTGGGGPRPRPRPRPNLSTAPTTNPDGTVNPGMGWPTTGVCSKCRTAGNLTAVGQCEKCVTAGEHAFCARCNGLMYRDGDVFRHGPNQGCDAVAPVGNKVPPPASKPAPQPRQDASVCPKCGRPAKLWNKPGELGWCRDCSEKEFATGPIQPGSLLVDPTAGPGLFGVHYEPGPQYDGTPYAAEALQQALAQNYQDAVTSRPAWVEPGPDHTRGPRDNETRTEGDNMTASTQSGEVTGIPSAVHYMTQVAATHTQHGGNEQLLTAMQAMNIGAGDVSLVQQAQEASQNAAELWTTAATTIEQHNAGVREGYGSAPDAADKHAQMAE